MLKNKKCVVELNRRLLIYQIAIQEKLRSIPSNLLRATLKLVELSANAFKILVLLQQKKIFLCMLIKQMLVFQYGFS